LDAWELNPRLIHQGLPSRNPRPPGREGQPQERRQH
jgi:hypothetical protein